MDLIDRKIQESRKRLQDLAEGKRDGLRAELKSFEEQKLMVEKLSQQIEKERREQKEELDSEFLEISKLCDAEKALQKEFEESISALEQKLKLASEIDFLPKFDANEDTAEAILGPLSTYKHRSTDDADYPVPITQSYNTKGTSKLVTDTCRVVSDDPSLPKQISYDEL